ncbi:ferritin-like domain-containing protein [Deinococcus radiopugnans]|uniref:Ferritin-like domain-containing protein n=1 Tax=Deinococcus radiopugnans ATCC 19172 TaxID=585398 RepID=A0A5C4Y5X1_9DEIO|nr:ferritin-like domain-containing protein [Deinococcus radiopugnans]MBB6018263.1 rubrerythrin [Deinococcus radiopugnans ATCC 19172]TNM70414.1 ferritin-like domain-containing protein [Deinococcus radiopugnans ATCC 19172]
MTTPTPNRRSFLKFAGAASAGAVMLGGVNMTALAATSVSTKSKQQDIEILNYALLLEYLEAEFYLNFSEKGALRSKLTNARVKQYADQIYAHEKAHVDFLVKTITDAGEKAIPKPDIDFTPLLTNPDKSPKTINDELFLALAATFEPIGVRAYLGQADKILTAGYLTAAASVLAVEANHASGIQELRRQLGYTKADQQTSIAPQPKGGETVTNTGQFDLNYSPTPTDFWKPLDMKTVSDIVGPLLPKS